VNRELFISLAKKSNSNKEGRPVINILIFEIHVADKQMHNGKVPLSYIIYYLHVSVAIATTIRVPSQEN
jgi:hypothetical protein